MTDSFHLFVNALDMIDSEKFNEAAQVNSQDYFNQKPLFLILLDSHSNIKRFSRSNRQKKDIRSNSNFEASMSSKFFPR